MIYKSVDCPDVVTELKKNLLQMCNVVLKRQHKHRLKNKQTNY